MATPPIARSQNAPVKNNSQRSSSQLRADWVRAVKRVVRKDRAILDALAAHDRGESHSSRDV